MNKESLMGEIFLFLFKCLSLLLAALGLHTLPRLSLVALRRGYSSCSSWASRFGDFFHCRAQTLGYMGSVVVAFGLSCSMVCEIFLDQGWNSCLS